MKVLSLFLLIIWMIAYYPQTSRAAASSAADASGVNPHAISLYNLGLSAYKQGSPESAIIFFKRAVDLDPDLADAQYNLGVLYQSERRLKEAVPRFEEALRVKPDDVDSHYQLALALIDLNQLPQARQHLLTIAPNSGHFNDAQKKIAFIDSQLSGGQANAPASQPQESTTAQTGQSTLAVASAVQTSDSNSNKPAPSATQPVAPAAAEVAGTPATVVGNASLQVVANGFAAPSGITFDRRGNLYIANFLNSTIDRITANGIKSQFSSGINLKGPIGLITDGDNNLYVANYLAGTVTKINAAGIAQIIASGLKKPYYLAMDKEGNLFVSQQEDNSVIRINFAHDTAAVGSNP